MRISRICIGCTRNHIQNPQFCNVRCGDCSHFDINCKLKLESCNNCKKWEKKEGEEQ